jgi:hypothetical protein
MILLDHIDLCGGVWAEHRFEIAGIAYETDVTAA